MTLKIRILRCSRRFFIILVSLTVTLFSEKMLIFTKCMRGFMSNSIEKFLDGIQNSYRPQLLLICIMIFQVHCQGEEHQHNAMSDEGKIWKFRPPPRTIGGQDAYKICPVLVEEGYCRFALQCTGTGLFLIRQCLAFSNFFQEKASYCVQKSEKLHL